MGVGFALTKDGRAKALVVGVGAGDHGVWSERRAEWVDKVRVHDVRVNEGSVGIATHRLSDLVEVGVDLRVWWFEVVSSRAGFFMRCGATYPSAGRRPACP